MNPTMNVEPCHLTAHRSNVTSVATSRLSSFFDLVSLYICTSQWRILGSLLATSFFSVSLLMMCIDPASAQAMTSERSDQMVLIASLMSRIEI
jgi:hypothetical protein